MKKQSQLRPWLIAFVAGAIGGGLVWVLQVGSLVISPAGMQYADLAAVMLGAVAVLLAIFGLFLAVFAIWGYSQFRSIVEGAATRHASQSIKEGELKELVEEKALQFMEVSFESGKLREILEDRVDQIILRGPEERTKESTTSNAEPDDL